MKNWYYGTGKKKTAIARVFIKKGKNSIKINKKDINIYILKNINYKIILEPLRITENINKFNIIVKVKGGGVMSQIWAIKHGLSKALLDQDKNLKYILSKNKLLTRDSRKVERKKIGKHKARKGHQFSKR